MPAPPPAPAPAGRASAPPRRQQDEQLAILQALERGEIDVEEATRRLSGAPVASASMSDEMNTVLRLVAEGKLSPEEAAPIIEALSQARAAVLRAPQALAIA